MHKQPKLLITGGSGFTGQHACHHFLKAGFDVTAVIRNNYFFLKELKIERCDLTSKDEVNELVKKVKPHYVLHLAGKNHVGQSWEEPISSIETNSMSIAYLLDSLRREQPSCKILVAGSALQFNPSNVSAVAHPYSLSKTLQILIAQSWGILYNMHIVIAKPSNLIGPGFSNGVCSKFVKKIVEMEKNNAERILEVNNLGAYRDFLDVRDAVSAYETLILKGESGEIYDIGSGRARSLKEIINVLKLLTDVDFQVKATNHRIEQPVDIQPVKLIRLGWKPSFSLDSSLSDILGYYRRIIE